MSQLHKMGLLEQRKIGHEGVPSSGNISKRFERWLEQSFRLLEGAGYLVRIEDELRVDESAPTDHQAAWEQWKRLKSQWHGDPQWAPTVGLVEALLHALPEVLTGHRAAAEVWFADGFGSSSKPLIAEVVGSGPVSRFCNDTIAHTVVQYIQHRQRQDPHCLLRILEVGAGTGSTTAVVLDAVKPYVRCLKEYACTDNSGAVIAALGRWLPADSGFVTYRTFDVDRSPEAQGIPIGTYDLVIGGNGLHATRDIRNAVRNAKATLKTNGLMLLHESTSNGPLDHLLGLLDEWWLFKDTELRIPGGPALEPESWKFVLQKEGFRSVSFLAQQMHAFGRQVIVSASDGVIRQRLTRPVLTQAGGVEVSTGWDKFEVPAAVIDKTATVDELMRKTRPVAVEQLLAKLRLHTAKTLGVDAATLDAQTRAFADMLLSELGMDSLSSNDLRSTLRQELGVDIPVQRIIGEKALAIAEALYDEILIRRITVESANIDEERETFVF